MVLLYEQQPREHDRKEKQITCKYRLRTDYLLGGNESVNLNKLINLIYLVNLINLINLIRLTNYLPLRR